MGADQQRRVPLPALVLKQANPVAVLARVAAGRWLRTRIGRLEAKPDEAVRVVGVAWGIPFSPLGSEGGGGTGASGLRLQEASLNIPARPPAD